jgi:ElaB/YqjD/DUF883 family membrane-anchored ribosome-binding protein
MPKQSPTAKRLRSLLNEERALRSQLDSQVEEQTAEINNLKIELAQALDESNRIMEGWKRLHAAVGAVYYSALWSADRPVDERRLWTELRDAAGFVPGNSPKPPPSLLVRAGVRFKTLVASQWFLPAIGTGAVAGILLGALVSLFLRGG